MGKQTKRRQRSKNTGIPQRVDSSSTNSSGSTHVINRVRHGDTRIRHGALTGLSTTLFSPETLSHNLDQVKYELVQAVLERIMDPDMPTAICAAGCIVNYSLFGSQQVKFVQVGVQVLPIALARLKSTNDQAHLMQQQLFDVCDREGGYSRENELIEKQTKRIMEQWTMISLCLNIIVALIENSDSDDSSIMVILNQSDDFLDMIFQIVSHILGILSHRSDSPNLSSTDLAIQSLLVQERDTNILANCSYYAMRTLHSCLDENPYLIRKLMSKRESVFDFLIHTIQHNALPALSRLHAAGIVVVLGQYPDTESSLSCHNFQCIDDLIVQLVLPLLRQYLVFHVDIASAMMHRIKVAEIAMKQTQMDEAIEKEVIQSVDRQKEHSRLIARRQAAIKMMTMQSEPGVGKDGKIEADVDSENQAQSPSSSSSDDAEDALVRYDKAMAAWTTACSPLKLALEITANLCTSREPNEEDMHMNSIEKDDVEMEDWDEEKERQLMSAMMTSNVDEQKHSVACQQLLRSDIPDIVITTFNDVFINCTLNSWNQKSENVPFTSSLDAEDILIKCGSCLGNMLSVASSWKTDINQAISAWKKFFSILNEALSRSEVDISLQALKISAITHVLGSFIRFRPSIIPMIDASDLSSISKCVSFGISNKEAAVTDVQKDSVNILGELCRHPHSDELNSQVCNILLDYLRSFETAHTAVMMEILNVLMDMYSADETDTNNHEIVFRSCGVLSVFNRYIPLLKRRISDERHNYHSTGKYLVWEETLLNAKRFVHYKKSRC